ncbi:probable pinoresinol-lariciresinol reductase 3 isoform X3 [Lotus japonicus]|uniref:probable pinoresinol-lariciresinol reductase 3 isoform X3 n=1 Tax=Lotus japonicus TaxID=34305 RepID=UPI002586C649|nr:probable pinoresinol-lariciresinol reductase 3 isoform X3 [Lotus japonicus]
MEEKSKILIIGATGFLGYNLAETSLKFGHPTFALVRDSAFSDPIKSQKLQFLSHAGATLLKGSLQDEASIVDAVKLVDVVICAVSSKQTLDQKLLIRVIKQLGTIKVLLPSLAQPGLEAPPRDKVTIFGDGNTKAVFMKESDVAAFTISAVDDPRTLNKVVYLRPPGNVYSLNELVEMWETKIGKKLEKLHVLEEELLTKINGTSFPSNSKMLFIYSAFIKGDHTYFDIESSSGVNGTELYPQLKYTTVSEFLDTLI